MMRPVLSMAFLDPALDPALVPALWNPVLILPDCMGLMMGLA